MKNDEGPATQRFWTHTQLAENLGMSRMHLYRWADAGMLLPPDIVIAGSDNLGWAPSRARRFGAELGRLDADGKLRTGPDGQPQPAQQVDAKLAERLAQTTYAKQPKVHLSSWLCSYTYGLKEEAVYFLRKRGAFITADVALSNRYGWTEPRVLEFGEQTGRLDDAGIDRWAVRRTREFGLSPETPWVAARAKENEQLSAALRQAVEDWGRGATGTRK